ncbi:MAG: trypsin-like peptidase domain-containing protein, partial [Clostridiaceae bacterium]|nr:trypsin-like peptidase domain-containing protein [Clostridiaceae bacterium]
MSFTIKETEIDSIVCKVCTDTEQGSGVICKVNNDLSYILTCSHVIKNSKEFTIYIKDNNTIKSIKVSNPRERFQNKVVDSAVIVINNNIDEFLKTISPFKVIKNEMDADEKADMILSGYPSIRNYGGDFNNIVIDECRYSSVDMLRTNVKLDTHTSYGIENCKGFSGGGIFVKYNNKTFLTSIASEYYE